MPDVLNKIGSPNPFAVGCYPCRWLTRSLWMRAIARLLTWILGADFEDQLHYIWSSFSALALDPGSPRKHSIALVGTPRTPTPPPSITLGCFGIRVDMFIPNPIRCFTCQKFGHGSKQCRGKQRCCFKCSDEGHEGTNCNSESSKCVNCGESHFSSSRDCPVYLKEKNIIKIKTERNISYPEAKQIASVSNDLLVSNRPSYASKVVRSFSHENTQTRMTWPIDADNFKMLPVETEPTDKILIPRKPKSSKTSTQSTQSFPTELTIITKKK
ncbi:Hypothetical predicted protein [Mytilus galloprovincialis]|uniref:CCHC-type domain-containing protein n=1 Tax=Mytilus galloprovincialis TaxID=29158 RepID=A0A8B6FG02_MYTGA|nr:Hypothetical predicted protein [Mytilus galloprovincialis]